MAYQSLYRRYRSQKFAEILGQPHVTTGLRSAVAESRTGHAYLFSGPRGTGKTSTARVLAKALNCNDLDDGEPCGICESCVAIETGKSYDLHELDAASNNKVDDVRDLISKVHLGSPGRTKVYILDEVHMLSAGAENALLKTLEEPPDHVVFVLATTEPQKVVSTIRSRTQHFQFHLLPADVLEEHVRAVIADAGLDVDDDAIEYVLRQGGGSARDTLSALDLVAAAGGVPEGTDVAESLVRAIGQRDPAAAIAAIQTGLELGRESRTIGEDTLDLLRNAFLAAMGAPLSHLNDHGQKTSEELAASLGPATLTRSLEAIGQTLVEMRQAPDPRVPLEVTLLRLTRGTAGDESDLLAKIEALEARIEALEAGGSAGPRVAVPNDAASTEGTPATADSAGEGIADGARGDGVADGDASQGGASGSDHAHTGTAPSGDGPAAAARRAAAAAAGSDATGGNTASRDETRRATPGDEQPRAPRAPRSPRAGLAGDGAPGRAAGATVATREARSEVDPSPAPNATPAPAPDPPPSTAGDAGNDVSDAAVTTAPTSGFGASVSIDLATATEALGSRLDDLSQKVRARFKGGRIVGVDGSTIRFGAPNPIHRDRCDDVKVDVENALTEHFGQPITIEVVIDASDAPTDPAKLDERPPSSPTDLADEEADIGPVAELADADDQSSRGVDRITKAFPGSQVIETGTD